MLETSGAVAVITGGGSGIGEIVAKHWVKNDGRVVLADVVLESLQRLEEEIQEMANEVPKWIAAGAQIIGGCCGTSLKHIETISAAVKGQK